MKKCLLITLILSIIAPAAMWAMNPPLSKCGDTPEEWKDKQQITPFAKAWNQVMLSEFCKRKIQSTFKNIGILDFFKKQKNIDLDDHKFLGCTTFDSTHHDKNKKLFVTMSKKRKKFNIFSMTTGLSKEKTTESIKLEQTITCKPPWKKVKKKILGSYIEGSFTKKEKEEKKETTKILKKIKQNEFGKKFTNITHYRAMPRLQGLRHKNKLPYFKIIQHRVLNSDKQYECSGIYTMTVDLATNEMISHRYYRPKENFDENY